MSEANPLVLVGAPVTSYKEAVIDQFIAGLQNLSYKNKEILLLDNSPDEKMFNRLKKTTGVKVEKTQHMGNAKVAVAKDRETIRQRALKEGFDFLLFLDQDIIPPHNVIEKLLSNKKEICCGLYFNYVGHFLETGEQVFEFAPVYYTWFDAELPEISISRQLTCSDVFPSRLMQIKKGGLGCALISKSVLQKTRFGLKSNVAFHEDFAFFALCEQQGIATWLDSSVACKHIISLPGQAAMREGWWAKNE